MKQLPSINFVKTRVDFFDQFIKWALSVGRLVVLLVELVALMTFFYRFTLDRQLIDLHTKIVQEQAIVALLKDQETTYRNLQDRIELANSYANQTEKQVKIFTDVVNLASTDLVFDSLTVLEDGVRVTISARDVKSLSSFVDSLREYSGVTSVSIDKIENKSASAIIIANISVLFEKE